MSWLQANSGASGRTRRRITALVIAGGLVVGATALAPTSGADEIGSKQAEAAKVADQLDALQSRQMDLSAQAQRVAYEQDQATQEVAAAQKLLDETNADLDLKRSLVRDAAVDAYQNGNDSPAGAMPPCWLSTRDCSSFSCGVPASRSMGLRLQ